MPHIHRKLALLNRVFRTPETDILRHLSLSEALPLRH